LRKIDLFGQPIRLTHEGEHEYKTAFGGGLTIILIVGLMAFGLQGFSSVLKDEIRSLNEDIRYLNVDEKPYFNPGELKNSKDGGFNLAWGFLNKTIPANIGKW